MSYTFALILAGALLLQAGVRNRPVREILLGITAARPGPGEVGFASNVLGDIQQAAEQVTGPIFAAAGGSWGGAKSAVDSLTNGVGLTTSSTKRTTKGTASGGVSDHWQGCAKCYAKDQSGSVEAMDKAAAIIMRRLGQSYTPGEPLSYSGIHNGFRIQVLWRVADHFDHIHTGARAEGYVPA